MRLDPLYPDSRLETLFDAYYMAANYEKAIEVFRRWHAPPVHMCAEFAAASAQATDQFDGLQWANAINRHLGLRLVRTNLPGEIWFLTDVHAIDEDPARGLGRDADDLADQGRLPSTIGS